MFGAPCKAPHIIYYSITIIGSLTVHVAFIVRAPDEIVARTQDEVALTRSIRTVSRKAVVVADGGRMRRRATGGVRVGRREKGGTVTSIICIYLYA